MVIPFIMCVSLLTKYVMHVYYMYIIYDKLRAHSAYTVNHMGFAMALLFYSLIDTCMSRQKCSCVHVPVHCRLFFI